MRRTTTVALAVTLATTAGVLSTAPVGDHPQRLREGVIAQDVRKTWKSR